MLQKMPAVGPFGNESQYCNICVKLHLVVASAPVIFCLDYTINSASGEVAVRERGESATVQGLVIHFVYTSGRQSTGWAFQLGGCIQSSKLT